MTLGSTGTSKTPIERVTQTNGDSPSILLPETTDPRITRAAKIAANLGFCEPILWDHVQVARHESQIAEHLHQRFVARGKNPEKAAELSVVPSYSAAAAVSLGLADGAVMGAQYTSGETVRAALTAVGLKAGVTTLSSCFWMLHQKQSWIFADAAVVPDPDSEQLAQIACLAAAACRRYLKQDPVVALLSFSTHGSASHPTVDKVRAAVEFLQREKVDFVFDGELQLDAAIVAEVAASKAPGSAVKGMANVLIFPDLNAGNIGYKLVQRIAGAKAIGPLLMGLACPVHDLSRGCSVDDIVKAMAVTTLDLAED